LFSNCGKDLPAWAGRRACRALWNAHGTRSHRL
jgi:hypothetical protein